MVLLKHASKGRAIVSRVTGGGRSTFSGGRDHALVSRRENAPSCGESYLREFTNGDKIVYDNAEDLLKFCDRKFKKFRSELNILTSSNREYVPYHLFDFFLSPGSFEGLHEKLALKVEQLKEAQSDVRKIGKTCLQGDSRLYGDNVDDYSLYFLPHLPDPMEGDVDQSAGPEACVQEKIIHYGEKSKNVKKENTLSLLQVKQVKHLDMDSYIKLSLQRNLQVKYLTTVQYCLFPLFVKNYDILIHSVKGTGKTLSYCLPLVHKIIAQLGKLKRDYPHLKENYFLALIICPNRILVEQTYAILKKLLMYHPYGIICHYMHGKKNMNMQGEIDELKKKKPHIIVSTPASLINHMKFTSSFKDMFFLCDTIIVDEAYFLLNSNYLHNVLTIKDVLPKGHQTVLLTCHVNNFLRHLAFRFLRLNYVYLNLVHNCVYDDDTFEATTGGGRDPQCHYAEDGSEERSGLVNLTNRVNPPFQLYHRLNAQLLSLHKNNILNCSQLEKLWYCKDAKTFYDHVNAFDAYLVGGPGHPTEEKSFNDEQSSHTEVHTSLEDKTTADERTNEEDPLEREYETLPPKYVNKKGEGKKREEHLEEQKQKLTLNHSDYNNYTQFSRTHMNYEENKGRNIPTHIFLTQEYLIYESDKLALLIFNILCRELLSSDGIKIVVFMPTVKMIQFFYVIFKHYIFKGYLCLLYLRAKQSTHGGYYTNIKGDNNSYDNGGYANSDSSCAHPQSNHYNKGHVTFSVSSTPFVLTHSELHSKAEGGSEGKNGSIDLGISATGSSHNMESPHSNRDKENSEENNCNPADDNHQREYELLKDVIFSCLHSKLSLDKKMYTLNRFNNSEGKSKQVLFASSLLCQGIEVDKVDLVIQVGVCTTVDEYVMRTNLATSKNTKGRSLLLLNELEGHYLFTLYKNNIMISCISRSYLRDIYKDNPLLDALLKYKRRGVTMPTGCSEDDQRSTEQFVKDRDKDDDVGEESGEKDAHTGEFSPHQGRKDHDAYNLPLRHIEWHKHEHLLCSCELMYRSLLGFYCQQNKFLKYEKWQVPSLIKSMIYSFGYFDNFYVTKSMAARLQILNAPDLFVKFNATPRSVLMSALPSYKGYKSQMGELWRKGRVGNQLSEVSPSGEDPSFDTEQEDANLEGKAKRRESDDYERHPLYFPIRTYLS
ncbi:RNA-helicase, putative [Plasmodium knowlesi strain H]|uniref:ATP-dependent RNA helicase n=3 Tax=Plasmodium knowlesi TaxID=5850 RepID=A0A5K1TUM8_PLAKH|nr:DEAD box ATP-dependent RNA helicase, putative [Plasmodium knowlesi strain H]OTN68456.1 putative RNA helicase [Plasmodium knowlesi]CAA9986521.1 DEAD box ATP-dependent RNA helicase, putative [Plasmodium knowlesi strain H]SBO24216.1 RNA-helicase, putative [Plasmodium knowlesi strain H]SBO29768.1 RNA-helicase, putative [Plasmodium knowlesi strain H]VVS75995.1 DEAD box ATP-dependent RNA helicase, putative [Plasmodium knowlesi strain H]|eukprot:XP_002261072.1 RNA helicase, putative [Plasmodium knowlesi strain H]